MAREKRIAKKNCSGGSGGSSNGNDASGSGGGESAVRANRQQQQQQQQRTHRYRPGILAFCEIRQYQRSTELIIRRAPFQRIVKEIMQQYKQNFNVQCSAMSALQVLNVVFSILIFFSLLKTFQSIMNNNNNNFSSILLIKFSF